MAGSSANSESILYYLIRTTETPVRIQHILYHPLKSSGIMLIFCYLLFISLASSSGEQCKKVIRSQGYPTSWTKHYCIVGMTVVFLMPVKFSADIVRIVTVCYMGNKIICSQSFGHRRQWPGTKDVS